MVTLEWDIPFSIISPEGTLVLNDVEPTSGGMFLLDRQKCSTGPVPLRITEDGVPQGDGSILHAQFKSGYVMKFAIELWKDTAHAACGTDLCKMTDFLNLVVAALLNPTLGELEAGNCRIVWTPSGVGSASGDRMLDRVQVLEWPAQEIDDSPIPTVNLAFHSPYPYAPSVAEDVIALGATVHNDGTTDYWPVFKIDGAFTTFTLTNTTTGFQIIYDSSRPSGLAVGGGDYAEIVTFHNTIYLNGNSSNLKAGIDIENSDFFPLVPGPNVLTLTGAGGSVKTHDAWA